MQREFPIRGLPPDMKIDIDTFVIRPDYSFLRHIDLTIAGVDISSYMDHPELTRRGIRDIHTIEHLQLTTQVERLRCGQHPGETFRIACVLNPFP